MLSYSFLSARFIRASCFFRAVFKHGRRVYFCAPAQNAKTVDLSGLKKSLEWMDGLNLQSNCYVTFDTAMNNLSAGQFKALMKKTAAQNDFRLPLNIFLSLK